MTVEFKQRPVISEIKDMFKEVKETIKNQDNYFSETINKLKQVYKDILDNQE